MLAVCGGYQLLGNFYKTSMKTLEGLGILDIYTEWEPKRLVSNIILDSPISSGSVVGFENHGGRTYIGNHTPFGRVVHGFGNTETAGCEGVICKNVLATYLHGPLLPKNPQICDYLLERALKKKYGQTACLRPLADELEHKANRCIAQCYCKKRRLLREAPRRCI